MPGVEPNQHIRDHGVCIVQSRQSNHVTSPVCTMRRHYIFLKPPPLPSPFPPPFPPFPPIPPSPPIPPLYTGWVPILRWMCPPPHPSFQGVARGIGLPVLKLMLCLFHSLGFLLLLLSEVINGHTHYSSTSHVISVYPSRGNPNDQLI